MSFPATRLRRLRRTGALRDLARETTLSVDDLVMPLFVAPEPLPNERLPGLARHTVDSVVREVEELVRLGVPAVILFGLPEEKDDEGSGAWIDDGIVQRALRALRPRFPELVLMTDVCLCEYTSHGHCGVVRPRRARAERRVGRDARAHRGLARRGGRRRRRAERHDGRAGRRSPRRADDAELDTPIMAYSAKYASAYYGPFREAADSAPAVRRPARRTRWTPATCARQCASASWTSPKAQTSLMVKPALPYLDVHPRGPRQLRPAALRPTTSAASTRW